MTDPAQYGWLHRRLWLPMLALTRMGATPEKLAWSIAVGAAVGLNPVLGTATLLCFALAFVLRLNVAASQAANYAVYPLEILLVVPFIEMGSRIFRTAPLPLSASRLLFEARLHPLALTRQLWLWEWHAFAVWAVAAAAGAPLMAWALTPPLRRWMARPDRPGQALPPR